MFFFILLDPSRSKIETLIAYHKSTILSLRMVLIHYNIHEKLHNHFCLCVIVSHDSRLLSASVLLRVIHEFFESYNDSCTVLWI